MRIFRTIVYTLLILAVLVVLIVKHHGDRSGISRGVISRATLALARAQENGQPAWVLVHSNRCQSCIEMTKVYKELEPEFEGRVKFINVDFDDPSEQKLIDRFKVRVIPTSIFIDPKGRVIEKKIGALSADGTKDILVRL